MKFEVAGQIIEHANLAKYNTWRVGGQARYLFRPASLQDLQHFFKQLAGRLPIMMLGLGSNVLLNDEDFPGVVIITYPGLTQITQKSEQCFQFEAGVACAKAAKVCTRAGLAEAAFFAGIPGTIGGALAMNAGAFQGETWPHVLEVTTLNAHGELKTRTVDEFEVGYRTVRGLAPDEWFMAAAFQFPLGDAEQEMANVKTLLKTRSSKQPIGLPSCGSVFRNPPGDHAARLIEACNLKGFRIGGAQVSEKHANFIVNESSATFADIHNLIKHIQHVVKEKYDVLLQEEVKVLPDN